MTNHTNNGIIPISELFGDNFGIPSYQRGYRWTRPQIEDLLNDFKDFCKSKKDGDYYCLQPLVVAKGFVNKERHETGYRVIDGQQRLTTVWLLMLALNFTNEISLTYERTDELSEVSSFNLDAIEDFNGAPLIKSNISKRNLKLWDEYVDYQWKTSRLLLKNANVESFHLFAARLFIRNWLKDNPDFPYNDLFNYVKVIWHEVPQNQEIATFQNLNGGKIPLTNAELIKAIFLGGSGSKNEIYQSLIAEEFDSIERHLRKDDFWYFLNGRGEKPTSCISFIFDLMQQLEESNSYEGQELRNYFYFRDIAVSAAKTANLWQKVLNVFHVLEGWYDDPEIYNLIGFLRAKNRSIKEIYKKYTECTSVNTFRNYLLYRCLETIGWYDKELSKKRDENIISFLIENFRFDKNKDRAWNLLLLLNVLPLNMQETVGKDKKRSITKFSFSDFHNCEWNIEHISPQNAIMRAEMEFKGIERKDLPEVGRKLKEIQNESVKDKIDPYVAVHEDTIMDISNLTFLSEHINKSIGNKPYDEKRDLVILKQGEGLYLPPSSLMIFTKGYTTCEIHLQEIKEGKFNYWSDHDRWAYIDEIVRILQSDYITQASNSLNEDGIDEWNKEDINFEIISPLFNNQQKEVNNYSTKTKEEALERFTYSGLIQKYDYIIIPKIQRDYAQGRSKRNDLRAAIIRNKLLEDVFGMTDKGIDFQIVFGSVSNRQELSEDNQIKHVFFPIDGQQRITTLYLLSLYRDKVMKKTPLKVSFIYDTRKAASDFCVAVVNNPWQGFPIVSPKEAITNSTWFQLYWLQDPTVDAMLRMLDAIHDKAKGSLPNYPDLDKIHFTFFDLGQDNRNNDIYLKMNTRGKELTQFENFKASLERTFPTEITDDWKSKIDSIWLDAFWNIDNPTMVPDSRVLRFIANALFVKLTTFEELAKLKTLDHGAISKFNPNEEVPSDIHVQTEHSRMIVTMEMYNIYKKTVDKKFISIEPFIEAFKLIGIPETISYLTRLLDAVCFYNASDGNNRGDLQLLLPYWDYEGSKILDASFSQRAAFYGATLYINREVVFGDNYREWMRFVWNMSENNVDSYENYIRTCRLFDAISTLGGLDNIIDMLKGEGSEHLSETTQYKEERVKATAPLDILTHIKKAEAHAFFHGTIRFLYNESDKNMWDGFAEKVNNLNFLIPKNEKDRKTVVWLIPYLSDDLVKDVFHRYYLSNVDSNLRDLLLYSTIRSQLQEFFLLNPVRLNLSQLKSQIIALAPRHPNYYIIKDWRGSHGCYPCVLTQTSTQSWYFASKTFVLDDSIYLNIEQILRDESFELSIGDEFKNDKYLVGLEIDFKYKKSRFRYFNINHTIRLMGHSSQKIDEDIENSTYVSVSQADTLESIKRKLDSLVEYSLSARMKAIQRVSECIFDSKPIITGFLNCEKTDRIISLDEICSYDWVSVETIRDKYAIAFTIDRHFRSEVGLRIGPGEKEKDKLQLTKPSSAFQYKKDNHFWYYVLTESYFDFDKISKELKLLNEQF